MAAPRGRTGPRIWWAAGSVVAYVTYRALCWTGDEVARLAVDTGRLLAAWWWVVVIALALVVVAVVRAAVRYVADTEPVEPVEPVDHEARPDEAARADVEQARPASGALPDPGSCPYGPTCPRCTGTGTVGGTALDHPARPAVEHDTRPRIEIRPARRGRPRRKAAL